MRKEKFVVGRDGQALLNLQMKGKFGDRVENDLSKINLLHSQLVVAARQTRNLKEVKNFNLYQLGSIIYYLHKKNSTESSWESDTEESGSETDNEESGVESEGGGERDSETDYADNVNGFGTRRQKDSLMDYKIDIEKIRREAPVSCLFFW